jgi:hypothetical protein
VCALPVVAGCSGADAKRAELLLAQAQAAQAAVSSESFAATLSVEAEGQELRLHVSGGTYFKGRRAGDTLLDVKVSAPVALPFKTMRVAKIGRSAWMELDGRRTDFPASATASTMRTSPLGAFDVARYVKDVKVQGGQMLDGRPVTKIVGILDTPSLLAGVSKFGSMAGATGMPNLDGTVGDTRVVIFVDDATHMLVAALADLAFHGDAGEVKLHLDLAISGINRPVAALSAS